MPPWTPSFGTFHSWLSETSIVMITVDQAAAAGIGKDHPVRFLFKIDLQDQRDDGLLSAAEQPHVVEFEAAVDEALQPTGDPWHVGWRTENGCRYVFYYLMEQPDRLKFDRTWPHGYHLQWHTALDVDWQEYKDSLAPTPFQELLIVSNRQRFEMGKLGDDASAERPVDHTVVFPDRESAASGAIALEAAGFTTQRTRDAVVTGTLIHDLSTITVEQAIQLVQRTVEEHGGTYDGWGAPIRSHSDPPPSRRRGFLRR